MSSSNIYSFWRLIDEYHITIPIIQRDYVQGRTNKNVTLVRQEFLNVLFEALHKGKTVELDFIYGTVNQANQFAPLDGQQRLTTLFLLHWYFAMKEGKLKENFETFQKFSYETRVSSKLFCKLLVSLTALDLKEPLLSKQIQNESNFYYEWINDQTIVSMLTVIDAIHSWTKKYELPKDLFEKLQNNASITFQFIDLDTFHLEDALYIKMNARGKPLTSFENFKARFQHYLDKVEFGESDYLVNKIDTTWSDYFWTHKQQAYDESFLQFFYSILYNQLARSSQNRSRLFTAINQGEAIRFEELHELHLDHEAWLNNIVQILDALCIEIVTKQETVVDIKKLIFTAMNSDINYTNRVQLYALVSYISLYDQDFSGLARWMRFIRNVSVNTTYNRVDDFMQSIQAIDSLVAHALILDEYLANPDSKLSGFFGSQLAQESIKAKLVLKDSAWKEPIFKAEDYSYFEGDISFLLRCINDSPIENWISENQSNRISDFKIYYEKLISIFGKDKLKVSNNLLSRALLTFGDYLIQLGQNHSFLIEGFDRDISWKRFLRHSNAVYLKSLLDQISSNTIEQDLEKLINNHHVTDWRKYFIQYPRILKDCCGNRRFIRFNGTKDILLLDTTMTSGYCQEYYSYAVYAELKKQKVACSYYHSVGAYNDKFVKLDASEYSLNFKNEQFKIYNEEDIVVKTTTDFDEAVRVLLDSVNIKI